MKKWEYREVQSMRGLDMTELNKLGSECWELTATTFIPSQMGGMIYFFKRETIRIGTTNRYEI